MTETGMAPCKFAEHDWTTKARKPVHKMICTKCCKVMTVRAIERTKALVTAARIAGYRGSVDHWVGNE